MFYNLNHTFFNSFADLSRHYLNILYWKIKTSLDAIESLLNDLFIEIKA